MDYRIHILYYEGLQANETKSRCDFHAFDIQCRPILTVVGIFIFFTKRTDIFCCFEQENYLSHGISFVDVD